MGKVEFGWGDNSHLDANASQFELHSRWEVGIAAREFQRLFHVGLLSYVGRVVEVFWPPQSTGLLFEFGPGMRDSFAKLVDQRAFPPKTLNAAMQATAPGPGAVNPDNPALRIAHLVATGETVLSSLTAASRTGI